jgi:3-phenylpropionate/cinnamic acid dioxygenase small subunit
MSTSPTQIANLLYTYAERIDGGDLEGAAALFRHARIKARDRDHLLDAAGILAQWKRYIKIYPDGTPRTRHVITNPIIDIDEEAGTATSRSCYTVFQSAEGFPLQAIASGRYHDKFERVDGTWRFSYRDYSLLDMVGDLSFHLKVKVSG